MEYYSREKFRRSEYWTRLSDEQQDAFDVTTQVLPFKVNEHVLSNLIDWNDLEADPMFKLLFPQKGMLTDDQYARVKVSMATGDTSSIAKAAKVVQNELNPHPAGQLEKNRPSVAGNHVNGIQHKYKETLLYFPAKGQTCHSFCSFCFRWPQFLKDTSLKMHSKSTDQLDNYLDNHPEISDVLITGGDPMVMSSRSLEIIVDRLLQRETLDSIRVGTKAIVFNPHRFVDGAEADHLMRLIEKVCRAGKNFAVMAHINHFIELENNLTQRAISRLRSAGATVRMQAPLLRYINDSAEVWQNMWRTAARLGCYPYYMFVERDTGANNYFQVPLHQCYEIYSEAFQGVSGLSRTARGPVMSCDIGKVSISGILDIGEKKYFLLNLLQSRDATRSNKPFLADFDANAFWYSDLNVHASLNG